MGDVWNGTESHAGRRQRRRALAVVPALALLLAGCAGAGVDGGNGNEGPMGTGNAGGQGIFGSSMETTTVAAGTGGSATDGPNAGPAASEFTCPPIQVRGGAAAWQVTDPKDGRVRYQATLGQFSRECHFTSPDMTMRIGIQGRVLLGPSGGPGKLTVPIRLAVVEEGPAPKSVWTKFYAVPVEVGSGVMQVDFGLVADDVTFPRPTPQATERYIVYVGFDPQGAEEKPQRQQKPPAQARPRPQATQPAPQATQQQAPKPRQTQTAAPAPAAATPAPRAATAAPTPAVQAAPATPAPTAPAAAPSVVRSQPVPAPDDGQTQWIGAPAPTTGTFSQ
ncbi:hypothetical protein GBB76_13265 [Ancylobacter sp. TS-1]|nr:hypothetical protein GBB76_13265 [Ancylobacter sp. TS-1]